MSYKWHLCNFHCRNNGYNFSCYKYVTSRIVIVVKMVAEEASASQNNMLKRWKVDVKRNKVISYWF